jgi:predicted HTH domain antitoxin
MARQTKNPTKGNDTPNTPDVRESEIARMKVDALRRELKDRGVKGTAELKKPDLVKKLIKVVSGSATSSRAASAKKSTAGGSTGATGSTKSTSAKKSAKNPTRGNDTPNTPDVPESKIARMKADDLREELRSRGVKGTADLKKPELVQRLVQEYRTAGTSTRSGTGKGATRSGAGKGATSSGTGKGATSSGTGKSATSSGTGKSGGGKSGSGGAKKSTLRTGKGTSKSLKYSQEIRSVDDTPERAGRSLVTTDHEVIRRWAEARKATPATVAGTGPGDTLGVLRFDFPGYGGETLRHVEWEQWFDTFDRRRLNFIYQDRRSGGEQSNFFQLESPDREDA